MTLLVFDVDGTLIDSERIIVDTQVLTLERFGIAHPGRELGLAVIGLSLPLALETLAGTGAPVAALTDFYKETFLSLRGTPGYDEPLYPGVADTLAALRGKQEVKLAIATGKSRRGVDHILDREGWRPLFASVQTADDAPSKPHPGMILRAMAETGASAGESIMIGDSVHDMRMAVAAGCRAVAVSWGFAPVTALREAGAWRVIESMGELTGLVDEVASPMSVA